MTVIGLFGAQKAGKTTVSWMLARNFGAYRMSFADPIREMLAVIGVSNFNVLDKNKPHYALDGRTPRHAMQTLGTEWGRNMISPHIWTNVLDTRLAALHERIGNPIVVIDDVRFDSEYNYLIDTYDDVYLVHIQSLYQPREVAPEPTILERVKNVFKHKTKTHTSEKEWQHFAATNTIVNNGSLEDLKQNVYDFGKTIGLYPLYRNT